MNTIMKYMQLHQLSQFPLPRENLVLEIESDQVEGTQTCKDENKTKQNKTKQNKTKQNKKKTKKIFFIFFFLDYINSGEINYQP